MSTKFTTCLAFLFLSVALTPAATISWSSAPYGVNGGLGENLNTGVFATTGTLILAENSGGSATTFDGINFTAGTLGFGNTFGGFHSATQLAREGTWAGGGAGAITLTGLTPGFTYRVQALVIDGRSAQAGRTVAFDGINQGQFSNGVNGITWGPGLLVTGNFVADAATQNFTVQAFESGGASAGPQLNALLLHQTAIPEPSSILLGSVGLLGLLRRRRA